MKKQNLITDTFKWLFDIKDWKMLFRSIPGLMTALFIVATVVMNLMALKTFVNTTYLSVTGGLLISWVPFLCMDILNKTYGGKAATKLTILGLLVNLACVLALQICVWLPGSSLVAFDQVYNQSWTILAASSIAFIVSGITNNVSNVAIGRLFKNNPDGKIAYMTRTYVSTALGQFIDNFLFIGLGLIVFPAFMGMTPINTWLQALGAGFFGAMLELVMEVIFSPLGYKICKKWRHEQVGKDYLAYCESMELSADIKRVK